VRGVGVDGAARRFAAKDRLDLPHRLERLVLDRLGRETGRVRRRDDVGAAREIRARHLVGGAADIHCRPGDAALVEGAGKRRLVDEIAARGVDEKGGRLHACERRRVDEVLGLGGCDRERHDEVAGREQRGKVHLVDALAPHLDVRIGDEDAHAEREAELGEIASDRAIADDAERAAAELAPHSRDRRPAGTVGERRVRDAAREIDHEAEDVLGDGRDEAGAGLRHQHAGAARRRHVDVADVDRAAHERDEVGQRLEDLAVSRRLPVRDDDSAAARRVDQLRGAEIVPVACVAADLAQGREGSERPLAIVLGERFGGVGEEDGGARHRARAILRRHASRAPAGRRQRRERRPARSLRRARSRAA
jgi:hypothetical protein